MNHYTNKTIGFVSRFDPFSDQGAWSGTIFKLREAMEKAGFSVVWVPVRPNFVIHAIMVIYRRFIHFCVLDHTYFFTKTCARSIKKSTERIKGKMNYYFFPGGAQVLKWIDLDAPVILLEDATFKLMVDYYWKGLPKWNIRQGDILEKIAISKSDVKIYSSKWAWDSAVYDYQSDPGRTKVIEFGANISEDINISTPYSSGIFRVLFSGVDWYRKGGEIAIDVVRLLNEKGLTTKLILVGCNEKDIPLLYRNLNFVEYVGFLDKNDKQQSVRYESILSGCHCLLLPTQAECSAIVFSEASAYGLPIFTYLTGGVANYVRNGVNGYAMDETSSAEDFADLIMRCVNERELQKLHIGALSLYEKTLSWKSWSERFNDFISSISLQLHLSKFYESGLSQ